MKAISLKFGDFSVCFDTAAFDTDTFQCEILYQKEGHLILCLVI